MFGARTWRTIIVRYPRSLLDLDTFMDLLWPQGQLRWNALDQLHEIANRDPCISESVLGQ